MDDSTSKIAKGVGAGCTGCGCLSLLSAVIVAIMVATGAFNYSVEGQATAGTGSSACCGAVAVIFGIALFLLAGRKSAATSTNE